MSPPREIRLAKQAKKDAASLPPKPKTKLGEILIEVIAHNRTRARNSSAT